MSQQKAVVLKRQNQIRFTQLWSLFAKSQTNAMRLSELMQFAIDRCLLNNRICFRRFYELFQVSTERRSGEALPAGIERTILKPQFIFLLNEMGKEIYHGDRNHQDRVYNDLLGERSVVHKDIMNYSRIMVMDEINRKLLMENAVKAMVSYQYELKCIHLLYLDENYWAFKKQSRLLLSQREVELQNKTMSAVACMRLLRDADVVPHLINVEHFQEILSRVVPPINPKESQFYYRHFLVDAYTKDMESMELGSEGDPGILLFQFVLTLARIAIQTSKEMDNTKKGYDIVIGKFLNGYLGLRTNAEIKSRELPNQNKIMIKNLKKFYQLELDQKGLTYERNIQKEENDPMVELIQKQENMDKMPPLQFNIPTMLKTLQNELPTLPPQMQVTKEFVPDAKMKFKDIPKVTMGQQPPPQKADKNKPAQKPAAKKPLKKGQKPPRVFQFLKVQQQTKKIQSSQDYFQNLATELDYSLQPLTSLQRGNIPLNPFPSIISEILYPPQVPQQILPYIQAGLNAHNDSVYALAIENYTLAQQKWRQKQSQLTPSLQLYFQYVKGSVFLSAGKDDYAFASFFSCRTHLDKMQYLSPDRALPYCGLGEALYNAEEYELAARAYLKAREIREALLGVEAVDTATTFCNLGCCFFMLDRSKQALSYFKIAKEVFIAELGEYHQRAQTARENVRLCNSAFFENAPEFRKLWEVYEKDMFGKKKKKKKKDGKKK